MCHASAFDPSTVRILSDAFDEAWHSLRSGGAAFLTDGGANEARENSRQMHR
jgi:hypothetical protein